MLHSWLWTDWCVKSVVVASEYITVYILHVLKKQSVVENTSWVFWYLHITIRFAILLYGCATHSSVSICTTYALQVISSQFIGYILLYKQFYTQ